MFLRRTNIKSTGSIYWPVQSVDSYCQYIPCQRPVPPLGDSETKRDEKKGLTAYLVGYTHYSDAAEFGDTFSTGTTLQGLIAHARNMVPHTRGW